MAEDDKQRLADLLSGMAEGLHQDDSESEAVEEAHPAPPPKPQPAVAPRRAPGPPPPQPRSASPQPRAASPQPESASPQPAQKPAAAQGAAGAASARPSAPARPAAPEAPTPAPEQAEEPLPPPEAVEEDVAAEEADDAVIVPAPPPTVLGHLPRKPPPRPHLIQSLAFRRTVIPVLLTLGVLCVTVVMLGFASPADHPFSAFARMWFALPALLIGAVLLTLAGMTMVQVKHDMAKGQDGQ